MEIKERGTDLFKKGNFEQAQKKYIKALRCTSLPPLTPPARRS